MMSKKEMLELYREVKDHIKSFETPITCEIFLEETDVLFSSIQEEFGSYQDFVDQAEAYYLLKLPQAYRALLSERAKKFDSKATKEDCINDLRRVQEENPTQTISRNFYREHGKYSDSVWNSKFGTFLEFRRHAGLELSRHQHKLEKDIAKHAAHDVFRDFYKAEVEPYGSKYTINFSDKHNKVILVASDFHDIDCDPFVLEVFLDTAKRLQPDVIVLNGDIYDCYDSSKFDKDIRELKIKERFDFVKDRIFRVLRNSCPNSQIDLILGNHEWRIVNLLAMKTPNIRVILSDVMGLTLAHFFGLDEFKINLVCKVDLAAFTEADRNKELRKNFRVYYDCFVVGHLKDKSAGMSGTSGHTHRPNMETFTNLAMGKCSWTETGCIGHTVGSYVLGRDQWTNSFMIAHIDTIKKSVTPEHILIPANTAIVHGIRYTRHKDRDLE